MNKASFHRKKQPFKIAVKHSVNLRFLPPYSSDDNPVEKLARDMRARECLMLVLFD